jgi:hypothetical protein
VVEASEGDAPLFQCQQVRYRSAPYRGEKQPNWIPGGDCTINLVMLEAERQMRGYLRENAAGKAPRPPASSDRALVPGGPRTARMILFSRPSFILL